MSAHSETVPRFTVWIQIVILCCAGVKEAENGDSTEQGNDEEKRTSRGSTSDSSRETVTAPTDSRDKKGYDSQEDEDNNRRNSRLNPSESGENADRHRKNEEGSGSDNRSHSVNEGKKNDPGLVEPPSQSAPTRGIGGGIDWTRLTPRCYFKPEEGNCAGSHSIRRWYFDSYSQKCISFSFPVCNRKAGAFLTCNVCMRMCLKTKRGLEKTRFIKKVCGTKL
ncbi:uncharacterized protein LOC142765641 isoform X2 [Rhipicephalus microplus]|uniref:uncharacterized protein LOC142765641 isoform X2 n=1 Tax=Rhipicephalus microplus TaxID=6941 RepID=UPI003F6C9597